MGTEKTRLLLNESIYWTNINTDIKNAIRNCCVFLIFRCHSQKIRCCQMRYQASMESLGADIFSITNKHYFYAIDYYKKFPVIKWVEGLSADNIMKHARLSLQNMDFPVDNVRCRHKFCFRSFKISAGT